MNVPVGQPKIAQRFNAGFAFPIRVESRRDGRNCLPNRRDFFRPNGNSPGIDHYPVANAPQMGLWGGLR